MNENGQRIMESDVRIYSKEENVKIYPDERKEIHDQLQGIKPQLIEYFKSFPIEEIIKEFGEKEAVIICLKFRGVGERLLSSQEISKMLGIDEKNIDYYGKKFMLYVEKHLTNEIRSINYMRPPKANKKS